jgi:A/G-specific adenine glycosylase
VKRVLARHQAFAEDIALGASNKALLALATGLLPDEDLAHTMPGHTQGIMDLGAGICTPRKPACPQCPVAEDCAARQQGNPERYPVKIKKIKRQSLSWWLLWAQDETGALLVERRQAQGIWGGLHCLPVFNSRADLEEKLGQPEAIALLGSTPQLQDLEVSLHVLTHRDLHLHPVRVTLSASRLSALASQLDRGEVVALERIPTLGWPTAIKRVLGLQR